jgi:quercetin dioxygenase-like cupin family protein
MIHPGDRLENPVTGEVLVFHKTAAETGGKLVRVETIVQPDGFVASAHVHPAQTERFEILEGAVGFRLGRETLVSHAGEVAVVPPGTPHRFWNAGNDEARFICEVRPALQFESLIETMFTLAAEGRTNKRGLPGPLQLGVIARAHFDTVRLSFPPVPIQRAALAIGAPVGRMLGYESSLVERAPGDRPTRRNPRSYKRGRPHRRPARRQ